jgi:glycosyltransferase involved in cell wall biosynthesis
MALLGGLAAWLAGVTHRIYTLRGLRYETTSSWKRSLLVACEKVACACAHQVICVSRTVRQTALADGIATENRLLLLGERGSEGITLDPANGIPNEDATRRRRAILGIPDSAAVIGFVGRLTRDKGIGDLVRCFQILRRQSRPIHLLIRGDFESGDPVEPETAAYVRTGTAVHWPGFVADPTPYYPLMDVFVFPTYREGMGRVLLEAAASGVPVVSTRTTGVIDVVLDGVTGILVPPRDASALARAVATLLDDPSLASRMARAGRELVREHFDNSIYLERLSTMLESLARDEPQPALASSRKEWN